MRTPVDTLLQIMQDEQISTRRRIQCAEQLLSHESPTEAVTCAQEYLQTVYNDKEQDLEWRMNAIEVARKYATPRVTTTVVHIEDHKAYVEKARRDAIFRRRKFLIFKGISPLDFPKDWKSDLMDKDWTPPSLEQVAEEDRINAELAKQERTIKHAPPKPEFDTAS